MKSLILTTAMLLARPGLAVTPIVTNQGDALGVTMPLYGVDRIKPAALLSIGKASIEGQRHGFFRVGILPLLVLENVEIEFKSQPPDATALGCLGAAFDTLGKTSAAELRDFAIVICGQPVLSASEARPEPDASVRLSKVVLHGQEGHPLDTATLYTTGRKAGEITYENNGVRQTENLFVQ